MNNSITGMVVPVVKELGVIILFFDRIVVIFIFSDR